ncbi:trypsin-like serine protease [Kitasatospora sp. NPDC085895]|uniref:trypsin-like serine protease n=1 Tax=Kitasatospora sp. NPDC085895 TaxID=3155057 RepID=UPI00344B4AFF
MLSERLKKAWLTGAVTTAVAAGLLAVGGSTVATADDTDPNPVMSPSTEYSFTARLDIGGGKRSCSGAVIDKSWVLTAASCFVDNPAAGIDLAPGAPKDTTVVTIPSLAYKAGEPIPTYTVAELVPRTDRDLVLARLNAPVQGLSKVLDIGAGVPKKGDAVTVAGYGRTRTEWAAKLHANTFTVGTVGATGIDLAAPSGSNAVICKGDTGGPAVRSVDLTPDAAVGQHRYRYELVAVNSRSWQNGCLGSKETEHSGAYDTRVDDLATWLQDKAGIYPASGYTPVTPTRVMDTRSAGGRTWAPVAGQGGNEKVLNLGPDSTGPFKLPQGASAVVLNVTVVNPSTAGFVAVEPNDKAKPTTSSVNFAAGQTVANLVTAPVGADGKVYLWTTTSDFDAIVDVAGYYSPTSPNKYAPQTPVRLLDTRSAGGPLGPGATKDVQITGQNGIPADATAAVVTLTAVQPTAGGFFIAHPAGAARPSTSNVNFTPGAIISNQAIVPIGAGGRISLFNSGGNTNAIVDLVGYYSPGATELFHPVSPSRLLDTRQNNGAPLAYGQVTTIGNLPATADAVVVNATTTGSDADGFFTLFAHGTTRPTSSSLNFSAGQNLSVHATVATGEKQIDLYNHATHSHAIVDLTGYFAKY